MCRRRGPKCRISPEADSFDREMYRFSHDHVL